MADRDDRRLVWTQITTTGPRPDKHRIVEVAAMATTGALQPVEIDKVLYFHRFIQLSDEVEADVDESCGCTRSMLDTSRDHGAPHGEVMVDFLRWKPQDGVFAGSNLLWTLRFLRQCCVVLDEPTDLVSLDLDSLTMATNVARGKQWEAGLPNRDIPWDGALARVKEDLGRAGLLWGVFGRLG